jgi:hypothetical protein
MWNIATSDHAASPAHHRIVSVDGNESPVHVPGADNESLGGATIQDKTCTAHSFNWAWEIT